MREMGFIADVNMLSSECSSRSVFRQIKTPVYRKGDKILYTGIYMQTTLQGWKCRTKNSGICGYREYYTVSAPGGVIAAICR